MICANTIIKQYKPTIRYVKPKRAHFEWVVEEWLEAQGYVVVTSPPIRDCIVRIQSTPDAFKWINSMAVMSQKGWI